MKRSIPPRTMKDISQELSRSGNRPYGIRIAPGLGAGMRLKRSRPSEPQRHGTSGKDFHTGLIEKPRNWKFQTKPLFKKIRQPLVDVFHEAEEVLIVIDLGGFQRGDISLNMRPDSYSLVAKRGDQVFREVIPLPPEVDSEKCTEHFRNGVLEIVLPRKAPPDKGAENRPL